ncbi:MAG: DUF3833 family protein [bacterium]
MKKYTLIILVLFVGAFLGGCSGMNVQNHKGVKPHFEPLKYFDGEIKAWGTFEGRWGEVKRQFSARFKGERTGDTLQLEEVIEYKNGDTETRSWTITKTSPHEYEFFSEQIQSPPAQANVYGNAMNMNYVLTVDTGEGSKWALRFDDWMFLQDKKTLINRATVSYYGFTVGNVHLFYRKMI